MPQPTLRNAPGDALIITDVQNDFLPGGALGVADGDAVVPVLNRYIDHFSAHKLPIFATRDWHPPGHCSFVEQGGPWPPHCIADSDGAAFPATLALPATTTVISKAMSVEKEAYSGFEGTTLHEQLQQHDIRRLFIGGLCTDYCVLQTVLDALALDYRVFLLVDAVHAVNVDPEDGARALDTMQEQGAMPLHLEMLV